jgi:tetratricopeptide (TPR) repeat protein
MKLTVALASLLAPAAALALELGPPAGRAPLGASDAYRRAVALDLAGRIRDALALYEVAGRDPEGRRALYHQELSRGVLTRLERLRLSPNDGRALMSLGVDAANKMSALRRDTGIVARTFYDLSVWAFRSAERFFPAMPDPIICLAGIYAEAGQRARARETLLRIRGQALAPEAVYNLAFYHYAMGEYDQALVYLGRVMNEHYRKWILSSDDFWKLRGDPRLERILGGTPPKRAP